MKRLPLDIESRAWRPLLGHGPILFAFDFDGTLTPIVPRPSLVRLRKRTWRSLAALAARHPCAVVTGRSLEDITPRLEGIPLAAIVGNHGLEWKKPLAVLPRVERVARRWLPLLEADLVGLKGIEIEDKRYSVSIHYRRARAPAAAIRRIKAAIRELPRVKVVGGKKVFNLTVAGAPDKGWAVKRLRRELGCRSAFFIGDDLTDENVFRLRLPHLVSVRVGRRKDSAAPWHLRGQHDIDELLDWLLAHERELGKRRAR